MTTPAEAQAPEAAAIDPDSARMMQFITGSFVSQTIRAFAELAIADVLAKQPATASDIALAIGAHAEATARLLRAGVALGLVTTDRQARFSATPLLQTLRQDAPGSLRGLAIALASPGTWLPWGQFVAAIRTGHRQTVPVLGTEYFAYLTQQPAEAASFTAAMDGVTGALAGQAARIIDTRSVSVAADIGGASGTLLHALLAGQSAAAGHRLRPGACHPQRRGRRGTTRVGRPRDRGRGRLLRLRSGSGSLPAEMDPA